MITAVQFIKTNFAGMLALLAIVIAVPGISQQEVDNPNLDQVSIELLEQAKNTPRVPAQVITIDNYDNFFLGVDFAEGHISVNTEEPTEFFTAFNVDGAHYSNDGHDWSSSQPSWGATMRGDPVTAYDGDGNLYYENMYGGGSILGCKLARSSDNGQTWDFVTTAISGFDKNWIAADQTDGPYANYVYTTMTGNSGGNFSRSTDLGVTWQNTWIAPTQSLPGMMVCVGPEGNTDGGAVYVVTNSGNSFASVYTFYKSTDGGSTFQFMSSQNFAGYVGDNVNGRNSVQNMRTRPYPFIAADNSDGPNRGRLYLVYASNNPPGNGNKPDIWSHYSDDGGATWSAALQVNSGEGLGDNYQWHPAIWCDVETGILYVQWMDTRNSVTNQSAAIYATYSDDGGETFQINQQVSNEMMVINCNTCGGGGTPRYQGDYNGITSNGDVSMLTWSDFRYGNFASFTAFFPDFAMALYPTVKDIAYQDTIWAVIPDVKLYDNDAIFTASLPTPSSGSFTITYPDGQSLTSFPDSIPIVITVNDVPLGEYELTVKGEGPNGTPIHYREATITVIPLPAPVADFTATATETCVALSIDFIDQSTNNPTSWAWTFEGGTPETSSEQNPTGITYPAAGSYDVTLVATNNSGTDEITKTEYITVSVYPDPPIGLSVSVCELDPVPPLEVTGDSIRWYNNPDLDTLLYSGNEFDTGDTAVGTYTYYATQTNGVCESAPLAVNLEINPLPQVSMDTLLPLCENDAALELTVGTPDGGTYFGSGVDAGFFNPAVAGAGFHTIGYAYADENSCVDTAYQNIMVNAAPEVTFEPLAAVCLNAEPFVLSGGSPEGGTYSGDGVTDNTFSPDAAGTGDHMITYTFADTNGCANEAVQTITVYELPQVDIGNDTTLCAELMVVLNAETPDAVSYLWTPGNYTTASITVDSAGIGITSQEFVVEVTDINGCVNTDAATVGFYDCTGIDEIAGLEGFFVFPNPSDGNFTISLQTSKPLVLDIKIFSASGQLNYEQKTVKVNNHFSKQITVANAGPGFYFVMLETENGKVFKKILIK